MRFFAGLLIAGLPALAATTLQAGPVEAFASIRQVLPSGQTVVVNEGPQEARSLGSFALRVYEPAPPPDQTVFFQQGLVRSRDGFVEGLQLADTNGDSLPEIIVIIRSAGTGGYLSAYSFRVDDQGELTEEHYLEGLPPDTDVVAALRGEARRE